MHKSNSKYANYIEAAIDRKIVETNQQVEDCMILRAKLYDNLASPLFQSSTSHTEYEKVRLQLDDASKKLESLLISQRVWNEAKQLCQEVVDHFSQSA